MQTEGVAVLGYIASVVDSNYLVAYYCNYTLRYFYFTSSYFLLHYNYLETFGIT